MRRITIQQCSCTYDKCPYYWLVGVGSFMQGTGFTKWEAQHIADLLNESADFQNQRREED